MFKQILAALAALVVAASAHAAVDVNQATQAELEAVKGIGPALSTVMVSERKKHEFSDWSDLIARVKGVGERSAAKFSANGLTVRGQAYAGAASGATAKTTPATKGRAEAKSRSAEQPRKARSTDAATAEKH